MIIKIDPEEARKQNMKFEGSVLRRILSGEFMIVSIANHSLADSCIGLPPKGFKVGYVVYAVDKKMFLQQFKKLTTLDEVPDEIPQSIIDMMFRDLRELQNKQDNAWEDWVIHLFYINNDHSTTGSLILHQLWENVT